MPVVRTIFLQFHSASISPFLSSAIPASNNISEKFTVSCCSLASPVTVVNGNVEKMPSERNEVRLGLPSKGRMATDTLDLLKVILYMYCFPGQRHHLMSEYTQWQICNFRYGLCEVICFGFWGVLQDCQLSVKQVNPRQYVAEIPQVRLILF